MDIEELDTEESNKISREILSEISSHLNSYSSPVEYLLAMSTTHCITKFRTTSLTSYDLNEFLDYIPKELIPFVDRKTAMNNSEIEYHNLRLGSIKNLLSVIEEKPTILKTYERCLQSFFMKNLVFGKNYDSNILSKSRLNAWLQILLLETNLSDLYALLSIKRFGFGRYISGIDDDGKIYTKSTSKVSFDKLNFYFTEIHPHASTFLSLDPKPIQELIPENATWATNPKRLDDYSDENNAKIGFDMLKSGVENKHFYSSLPLEVIINDKNIKKITVKDVKNQIYFCTTFSDDSISIGQMGLPDEDGRCLMCTSDVFSNFITNNFINSHGPYFLFDLVGSIARDMFICEERTIDKEFNVTKIKAKSEKVRKRKKIKERIIWLPRTKINLINRKKDDNYLIEQIIKLSPSHVTGHPRKCEKPSKKQIELAETFGVYLPLGYTYIREHNRSGSEVRRLYKSRSAVKLLFSA